MQVQEFLEQSARRLPEKTAFVCRNRRYTYRQLDTMADRLARSLAAHGVAREERVAVYLDNSVAAVVAINPSTKPAKLQYILNNCRAAAIVTTAPLAVQILTSRRALPHLRAVWASNGGSLSQDGEGLNLDPILS